MAANSFSRNITPETSQTEEKGVLRLGADDGTPIKINKDGTIEAKGFIDSSDNLEFFANGPTVFAKAKAGKDTSLLLNLNTNKSSYSSLKSYFLKFKNAFLSFSFPRLYYSHVQQKRTIFLSTKIKRIISTVLTSGSTFIYHFTRNNKIYANKVVKRFQPKIFKVPVQLKFANSFENLNDLIVIKTGQFNYVGGVRSGFAAGGERIVYVSPHEELSGLAYYKSTGSFRHVGTGDIASVFSGSSGNGEALVRSPYYYLSSKNYAFPINYTLSGGAYFFKRGPSGNFIDTQAPNSITGTNFYSVYTGLTGSSIYTDKWNGIIPAYTPFYIETWSTNGFSVGYDGAVEVVPVSGTGFDNLEIEVVGFGQGNASNQSAAETNAEGFAQAGALRKLESALIKMNATESGSSLRKYVKHIEKQTEL